MAAKITAKKPADAESGIIPLKKGTKQEILEAYETLLTQVQEQKSQDPIQLKSEETTRTIIEKTEASPLEKVIQGFSDLKISVVKAVDILSEKLTQEMEQFTTIQKAVAIKKEELEALYGIRSQADSLSALVLAYQEKNRQLEDAYQAAKQRVEREKEAEEYAYTTWKDQLQKKQEREAEDIAYQTQLQRQKDQDEYEARKSALEKELEVKRETAEKVLKERENAVTQKEREFTELKEQVTRFPQELEAGKEEIRIRVTTDIETAYKHQTALAQLEIAGERNLYQQRIHSLEEKIKEQAALIKDLSEKASEAELKVQGIAIKAIEGAGQQRIYHLKTEETAR